MLRRIMRITAATALLWALPAASASAHGLPSPPGVPVPAYLFSWGAGIILVLSFIGLGALWSQPRLEGAEARPLLTVPRGADPLCGAVGVALFALVVYAGFDGTAVPARNLAPTFVYVLFWVGLVPVTLVFGDVFSAFNPWRALGRAFGRLTALLPEGYAARSLAYPGRRGRWPAVAGLAPFAWLELVDPSRSAPETVAKAALIYAAIQLGGMALFGVESCTRRGDAFAGYFGLIAGLSPLQREGRQIVFRSPLAAGTALVAAPGTVALLCVMIGSTGFDGLSATGEWSQLSSSLEHAFLGLGASASSAVQLTAGTGLAAMIALVAVVYRLGVAGMRSVDRSGEGGDLAQRFVHTLVPIAAAYVLAHYFTFLVFQGQAIPTLASDPLGTAGLATATINYRLISPSMVWYFQVGALVAGHVAALVLAHDRALLVFRRGRTAVRSQYWMLIVMVGYTSLGLFLLASIKR